MNPLLARPNLALRGYDLVQSRWAEIAPGETYLKDDVLPKARTWLSPESIQTDPRLAFAKALAAHRNLLSQFEIARAKDWAEVTDPDNISRLLMDLLYGDSPLEERAVAFLSVAGDDREVGGKKVRVNVTTATYLLAMADPTRHAFAKPDSALHPAALLLCKPAGEPSPGPQRAGRVGFAARLYGELRDLWAKERGFEGDLLDVHTRLFVLGKGFVDGCSWADALTPEILGDLVREYEAAHPEIHKGLKDAADLMGKEFIEGQGEDPMGTMPLPRYAYGTGNFSFCSAVESATRSYIAISLGNASAHGVGKAKNGTWRILKKEGHDQPTAEDFYLRDVRPRLVELQGAAKAFVEREPVPQLKTPRLQGYRSIDAKAFCLLVSGFDYETARDRLFGVLNITRMQTLARLLGAGDHSVTSFTAYLATQWALAEAVEGIPLDHRPAAQAIAVWTYESPVGRKVADLIEGGQAAEEEDEEEEEGETVLAPAPVAFPVDNGEPAEGSWEALHALLEQDTESGEDLLPIARVLASRVNAVLYGPPGTGKTYLSVRLAQAWRIWQGDPGTDQATAAVEQVTFHPSYGYEDFVEAYRPTPSNPGQFELTDGILPVIATRAAADPKRRYLLLIDELNRGDVARILGELITLLERDKRCPEHARRRMLSGKPLWLPPNLFVLGTMNTADKSVSLLDVAIRRRFAFIATPPRPDFLNKGRGLVEEISGIQLRVLLSRLNDRLLEVGVLPDRLIGHSLLWLPRNPDLDDDANIDALAERFLLDIVPLVEEYCFSDRSQMKLVLGKLVDDRGQPRVFDGDSHEPFLEALREICIGKVGSP